MASRNNKKLALPGNHGKSLSPVCPICRQVGMETLLLGLFDDRFGAPGTYDSVRCRHCGVEQI